MRLPKNDNGSSYFKREYKKNKLKSLPLKNNNLEEAIKKCYAITSHFEGTHYNKLVGNFDGSGFTYGIFGFNLGQGTLQNLILAMNEKNHELFKSSATTLVNGRKTDLSNTLLILASKNSKDAVEWSLKRQDKNHVPLIHWVRIFDELGEKEEFQQIQRDFGKNYMDRAIGYAKKYNIKTERGLALLFDTCIQQGSITIPTQTKLLFQKINNQPYHAKLKMIATAMSEQTKEIWKNDVYSRRITIVNGKGKVHGELLDINKIFGITDNFLDF